MKHDLRGAVRVGVAGELAQATEDHGPFNSRHEGYAVVLEEFDELSEEVQELAGVTAALWVHVKGNQHAAADRAVCAIGDLARRAACEAIRLAAMADRFRRDQPAPPEEVPF